MDYFKTVYRIIYFNYFLGGNNRGCVFNVILFRLIFIELSGVYSLKTKIIKTGEKKTFCVRNFDLNKF